ncbi:MAG: malonyl-ACP O-methyltransferase BioC [Pseudomonadota bacterium]
MQAVWCIESRDELVTLPAIHAKRIQSACRHQAPELVLIHGWGLSSAVWSELIPSLLKTCHITVIDLPGYGASDYQSGCYDQDVLLPALAAVLPKTAVFCGWSLGGNIALALSQCYPERCLGVVSIASNPCFIQTGDWPGVAPSLADQAVRQLQEHPETYMAHFLGVCAHARTLDKSLWRALKKIHKAEPLTQLTQKVLQESLNLVHSIDMRSAVYDSSAPVCFIHAADDALSSHAVIQALRSYAPHTQVHVVDDAPHALMLSHSEQLGECVAQTVSHMTQQVMKDKERVASSFGAAASTYDAVAQLQQQSSDALLSLLDDVEVLPRARSMTVLDLACGTGYALKGLAERFPNARVIAADLAHDMLSVSGDRGSDARLVCADFEQLPFRDSSVDVVFSNMGFQWALDIGDVFKEVQRVLSPSGVCVFSTFLPDTLCELRAAWQAVDPMHSRVNECVALEDIRSALAESRLLERSIQVERMVKLYPSAMALMKELKLLGAHTSYNVGPKGLIGKHVFSEVERAYERDSMEQHCPATYEVLYVNVVKQ